MPPAVCVSILSAKLSVSDDRVLKGHSSKKSATERGTLQGATFDVDVIVELWVAFTGNHGEKEGILAVESVILNLEPELDRILTRPLSERRCRKINIAIFRVQMRSHVAIITCNTVEDLGFIQQCATKVVSFLLKMKEDVFESSGPFD